MSAYAALMAALTIVGLLLGAVIHIVFAIGVYEHAARRLRCRRQVHFAGPMIWALAALLGGVFAATAYWAMHISNLSDEPAEDRVTV